MSQVQLVPQAEGLQVEEAQRRLQVGWQVIPGISLVVGSQLATPSAPVPMRGLFDVWIPPMSMIPETVLVGAMLEAEQRGADVMALEVISVRIFGIHYSELKAMVQGVSQPDGALAS